MFVSAHSTEFFFLFYCNVFDTLYSRTDSLANSELLFLIKDRNLLLIYLHLADSSFSCVPPFQSPLNWNFHLIDAFLVKITFCQTTHYT